MGQRPLTSEGGQSPVVSARLPGADLTRLTRLAERRGQSRSATARELLAYALDRLDLADTGPP